MKKYIFPFIVLLCLAANVGCAQDNYVTTQLNDLIGQLNWNKTISTNLTAIEGSPYLHDEFQIGEVFYDGKYKISNLLLRYNLYNDDIEYKEKNVELAIAEPQKIDKVIINNEVFIYINKGVLKGLSGFVKMWNEEMPSVITKMEVEFKKREPAKPYTEPIPDRFERKQNKHYIMKSKQEILTITSTKKLINYLGNHTSELSKFAEKNKISSGDPEELAELLDYFHGL